MVGVLHNAQNWQRPSSFIGYFPRTIKFTHLIFSHISKLTKTLFKRIYLRVRYSNVDFRSIPNWVAGVMVNVS